MISLLQLEQDIKIYSFDISKTLKKLLLSVASACFFRCGCIDAALDRRYFDQPFACIRCHGSIIESVIDYFEWNPITVTFVPPGDAYGDCFVDAGIATRVILRSTTTSLHRVHQANKSFGGNFKMSDLLPGQ